MQQPLTAPWCAPLRPASFLLAKARSRLFDLPARVVVSVLVSVLIASAAQLVLDAPSHPEAAARADLFGYAFVALALAPLLENTLLVGALELALLLRLTPALAIALVAVAAAAVHASADAMWGLVVLGPFAVFCATYLAYRPQGKWMAFLAGALVHAGQNLFALSPLLIARIFAG